MLTLNFRDTAPIYGQIRDGLRRMIVTGAISADEKLPSVRSLAMDLAINPNTIQRAYGELERSGYIYMVKGRGSFVGSIKKLKEVRRLELSNKLSELAKEAECLDMDKDEFTSMASEAYSQMEKEKGEKNV